MTNSHVHHPGTHPLQQTARPDFERWSQRLRSVDLFCGCGGLTLGLAQAAHSNSLSLEVALAVDMDINAIEVFVHNFPQADARVGDVTALFDGGWGEPPTSSERMLAGSLGPVDVLIGGPPCQGNSNLNNHTRRRDPKNALYGYMARAAEVLSPSVVLIENVPSVVHDRARIVDRTSWALDARGYTVAQSVISLHSLGVAQKRRRHVLLAFSHDIATHPAELLESIQAGSPRHDLRWAIGDLCARGDSLMSSPSTPSAANASRLTWLFENDAYDLPNRLRPPCHRGDHSYKSMYGRLKWSEPAQTLTSGFGSMGQGRYVHPEEPRTLTPHEAARIQGFPDYFSFAPVTRRGALARMIGNAVPPQLTEAVFNTLLAKWNPRSGSLAS